MRLRSLTGVARGFAFAPLSSALVLAAYGFVRVSVSTDSVNAISSAFVALFLGSVLAYASWFVLGLPGLFVLRWLGWTRRSHLLLFGSAIGAAPMSSWVFGVAAFVSIPGYQYSLMLMRAGELLAIGAAMGIASGAVFSRLVRADDVQLDDVGPVFD